MPPLSSFSTVLLALSSLVAALPSKPDPSVSSVVNQTTCGGRDYTYQSLAGYGFIPSNARDKYGDTIGGIGSSAAIDQKSWKKNKKSGIYTGILYALPDRGWNTQGTLNFQARIHKLAVTLTPDPSATVANPSPPNLQLKYLDTILLSGPDGTPTTGLDADATGGLSYPGFPLLPAATYTGNGFGGPGPGGKRISLDPEGLVLASKGFYVSDEYGPYIYHFSTTGTLLSATAPPDAYLPHRNSTVSFSADSPPAYDPTRTVTPSDTTTGRNNNQGLEGLTASSDGKTLYALLQSALDQEGGPKNPYRRQVRLLEYDVGHGKKGLVYKAEYVVTLPLYTDPTAKKSKATKVAAQSEIHSLGGGQFLILSRDNNAGHGQDSSLSVYRHADIFSIPPESGATNIKSPANDAVDGSIASATGVLDAGITAAEYCPFLDFNVNSQLNRFGVHNGGAQDAGLLNEKWESLALVPVDGKKGKDGEFFLFSLSDNDFVTQDGYLNGGKYTYKDASGYNLDNQALVFQIKLPRGADPS